MRRVHPVRLDLVVGVAVVHRRLLEVMDAQDSS